MSANHKMSSFGPYCSKLSRMLKRLKFRVFIGV